MFGLAALGASHVACAEEPEQANVPPPDLILELDGMRFWRHEIEPLLDQLLAVNPRRGRVSAAVGILDTHLIPLKLAERAFAERRREMRERAEALARVVGNGGYPKLVAVGRQVAGDPPEELSPRSAFPLPVAAWAFDDDRIGQVSPVLASAAGFSLVSTYRIERELSSDGDLVEAFHVSFPTHAPEELAAWLALAKTDLAGKVSYVHPDYRRSLPPWLQPQ